MKIILSVTYYLFLGFIVAVAALLIVSIFPIPGNIKAKVVLSGSMEPDIKVGSVVVIRPAAEYRVGDIVTFGKDTRADIPTTHRITEMRAQSGEAVYKTKGDANQSEDYTEVKESEILGKVLFSIPYLGYVIDFAKKPFGFFLLVIVPAGIIALDEVRKIAREVILMRKRKRKASNVNAI